MSTINKMLKKIGPNKAGNYYYVIWHAKKQLKRGRNPSACFIQENGEVIKEPRKALAMAKVTWTHDGVKRAVSKSYFNERMNMARSGYDIYAF